MYHVDLNSDMGEVLEYKLGGDEEIIKYVTTANVHADGMAGDPMVMDKTVRMAKERGVMVALILLSGSDGIWPEENGSFFPGSEELCEISDWSPVCLYKELWYETSARGSSWRNGKSVPV